MRVSFEERSSEVVFRIEDTENKYAQVLTDCYYQRDGQTWFKRFPASTKDLDVIMCNYTLYAQEMFDQLGYFRPIPWEKALSEFISREEQRRIDWWLAGSCAASVRGIPIRPHDIDVIIDSRSVEVVHDLFLDHIVEPIIDTRGWVTKDFGVAFLYACIDIASDPQPSSDRPEPADFGQSGSLFMGISERVTARWCR